MSALGHKRTWRCQISMLYPQKSGHSRGPRRVGARYKLRKVVCTEQSPPFRRVNLFTAGHWHPPSPPPQLVACTYGLPLRIMRQPFSFKPQSDQCRNAALSIMPKSPKELVERRVQQKQEGAKQLSPITKQRAGNSSAYRQATRLAMVLRLSKNVSEVEVRPRHPIIVSSFSRKSRSSYPYKLSKPVFGLRPDYNLKVSRQLSRCPQPWIGLHLT